LTLHSSLEAPSREPMVLEATEMEASEHFALHCEMKIDFSRV
jgi:hypothetical protein